MAELSIIVPGGVDRRFRLHRAEVIIGRDAACDVPLDDGTCSRRHVRIYSPRAGRYVLEDLGSHNGTYVNGERVPSRTLVDGDEVRVGRCVLRFADRLDQTEPTVILSDEEEDSSTISVYRHKPSVSESRLNQLLDLSSRLVGALEHRDLLERAMDICMETLDFDRALIVELPRQPGPWQVSVNRNLRADEANRGLPVSRSILNRAIDRGERTIINNAIPGAADVTESMIENRIRSAMCVPITWQEQTLGAVYGDRLSTAQEYGEQDVNFLAGLAAQIGAALKTSQWVHEAQLHQQLQNELTIARQIQEGLFPHALPDRPDLAVVAFNNPGRSVSGDYYDVIELDDHRIGIIIADVSGKGVAAAMLMANLQAAVRVMLAGNDDLVRIFQQLNRLTYDNTNGTKFITALLAVIDTADRVIRYVNAGHYPPYRVFPDGRVETLGQEAGLPLGVEVDTIHPLVELPLGDQTSSLFLFTDGMTEALNHQDEFFGLGRIEDLLRRNAQTSPGELVNQCRRTVAEFVGHAPQGDDVTLMAIRIGQARSASQPTTE